MSHTVRTSNGDSTNKILPDPQMGGIGQGSGGGPPCNHVQTIPMINTLGKLTRGCTMFDPTRKRCNKQHVVGWVDDNTNKESYAYATDYRVILASITLTCQIWRRLIRITGGDLAAHKCVFFLVTWKFTCMNTIPYIATKSETPGIISFPADEDNKKLIKIDRKDPGESERIVGLRFNPKGTMRAEFDHRMTETGEL